MVETKQLTSTVEKVIGSGNHGANKSVELWMLKDNRVIEVHKSFDMFVGWSLDASIPVEIVRDERKSVNKAQILLRPEEVLRFTQALIQHPILLPINYSQKLSKELGMYCLRIASQEPLENFTERLSEALNVIESKK